MLLKEILDIYNLLDSAHADGNSIKTHLLRIRSDANVEVSLLQKEAPISYEFW